MESVIVFHIYAEFFYSFEFFLSKFFQTNLFSPIPSRQVIMPLRVVVLTLSMQ